MRTRSFLSRWRRLFRIRLLTALVLLTVIGVVLSGPVRRAHHQRVAVRAVLAAGGTVTYDWEKPPGPGIGIAVDASPPGPKWLRKLIGDSYFQRVVAIGPSYGGVVGQRPNAGTTQVRPVMSYSFLTMPSWDLQRHPERLERMLKSVAKLRYIRRLSLGSAPISDDSLRLLHRMRSVTILDLSRTKITGEGLAHLRRLKDLTELNLSGTLVSDSAMAHIRHFPRLRKLNMSASEVHGRRLRHLAELTELQELDLSYTLLGYEINEELPALRRVHHLNLRGCRIMLGPTLYWSAIYEEGGEQLYTTTLNTLSQLDGLKELNIHDTNMTVADVQAYQAKRPKVDLMRFTGHVPEVEAKNPAPPVNNKASGDSTKKVKVANDPFGA